MPSHNCTDMLRYIPAAGHVQEVEQAWQTTLCSFTVAMTTIPVHVRDAGSVVYAGGAG